MANGGGIDALRRRIEARIRAGGFEPEPGEIERRTREEIERRAARARIGEARLPQRRAADREARNQRARVLGIRVQDAADVPGGNRATYNRSVIVYAVQHGMRYQQVRRDPTFQYWYAILREQENRLLAGKPVSRDPRGLYALALRKLGYKSDQVYRVGESPTFIQ